MKNLKAFEAYIFNKEYQDNYIKNMSNNNTFRILFSLDREFRDSDAYLIYSKDSKLYRTDYPSAPRWVDSIYDVCRFNGLWKTKIEAQNFNEKMNNIYGEEFSNITYVKKKISDLMKMVRNDEVDPYGEENWVNDFK